MKQLSGLRDFSAGINVKDAATLIPDNALTEAQNAIINKGYVSKRHGYERHVTSPVVRVSQWGDVGRKKWSDF